MRFLEIEEIEENDILACPLFDDNNRLLIKEGKPLSKTIINKIKSLGIPGAFIEDDLSDDILVNDVISRKLKSNAIKHLRNFNIDKALDDANKIVAALQESLEEYDYINKKTFDNYTYEHSLSVSVYATVLGIACNFTEKELQNLSLAGLLHDMGKKCIDEEILNKPSKLTEEEFEVIKNHPRYGYNLLKDSYNISATVKATIIQHHENENGSGYPYGIKGKSIYKFAKIIHIVDVYDALISKRPYKEAKSPMEAINFIISQAGTMFDSDYVDIFLRVIPAYPRGVTVELSNGEKGIVIENHKGYVLRPKIRLLNGEDIDLKNDIKYKDINII